MFSCCVASHLWPAFGSGHRALVSSGKLLVYRSWFHACGSQGSLATVYLFCTLSPDFQTEEQEGAPPPASCFVREHSTQAQAVVLAPSPEQQLWSCPASPCAVVSSPSGPVPSSLGKAWLRAYGGLWAPDA